MRGARARPVVKEASNATMHASWHVIEECAKRSDRCAHSLGIVFMHGSMPSRLATSKNHRRPAVEYARFVDGCTVLV